jgi:hypothetical protein
MRLEPSIANDASAARNSELVARRERSPKWQAYLKRNEERAAAKKFAKTLEPRRSAWELICGSGRI